MENPYQSPETIPTARNSGVFPQGRGSDRIEASLAAQSALYRSKGWVRFISVLGFIYFALIVLIMLWFIIGLGGAGGGMIVSILMFFLWALATFTLSNHLARYASAIGRTEVSRDRYDLEMAMVHQMKFWKLVGILILILLALFIVGFAVAILSGNF